MHHPRIRSLKATLLKERVFWARHLEQIVTIADRRKRTPASPERASVVSPGASDAVSGHVAGPAVSRRLPVPGSVLVEIETDSGHAGVGLGGGGWPGVYVAEHYLAPLLLEEDPSDIGALWERMYSATVRYGQAGIVLMAMSAVDLALWDLKGKMLGQPVWQLLGGKVRDRVPVYATIRDPRWVADHGFCGVKLGGPYGPSDGLAGMRQNEAYVAGIREGVGSDLDIMIDCARTWTVDYTVEMARILAPYRITFIEEPVMPRDVTGYAEIRRRVEGVAIAGGEHAYTIHSARQLLEGRALDIIQPDIRWTGGLTETLRICDLAREHGIQAMPHRGGMAWSLHAIMARSECVLAEGLALTEDEARSSLFEGEPVPENGWLSVSDAPGFGLTLCQDRLGAFRSDE